MIEDSRSDRAFNSQCCIFAVLLVVASISGCARKTIGWTEEVELSDGRIIQVRRADAYRDVTPLGERGEVLLEQATLYIEDKHVSTGKWTDQLMPIFLDIDKSTREFVLICTADSLTVWEKRGKPHPQYWQFRLRDGRWNEEKISDFAWGRKTNLVIYPFWIEKPKKLVTLAQKQEFMDRYAVAKSMKTVDPNARLGE